MYSELKGKTALVTGSGKKTGIGYAIAEKFAANGSHVIIADLGKKNPDASNVSTATSEESQEIAADLSQRFGVKALPVNVDVTDNASITAMVKTIQETFAQVDILCNNAGATFGVPDAVHTYNEDAWMKTIDVNLHSVFKVSRAVLPLMMEKGGAIINTSSRAGKVPPLFNGAYAVAKAGVIMLTKVMARELAGNNIRINAICPGQIMTDLEKWRFGLEADFFGTTVEDRQAEMCKTIPLNRIGEPDEVAKLVVYLASDESSYLTGQAINVTGGQLMEL
jgi:3-oxoacyl-[acyl-carrier protein] reductase